MHLRKKDLGLNNWRGRSRGSGSQMALLHGGSSVVMSHCRFGVWLAIVLFVAEEEGKQKVYFCGQIVEDVWDNLYANRNLLRSLDGSHPIS